MAVLLVVMFHFLPRAGSGPIGKIASFGWSGVDAFLVLSGFLITGILFRQRGVPHFFRNFYTRRVLRLFPLYYFILLLALALTPIFHIHWQLGHIPFLFYGANIVLPGHQELGTVGPLNLRHFWTLALEEQFYLIWPWVVGSRLSRQALLRICFVGIVFAFFLRIVLVHFEVNSWQIYESLPTRMDSLLLGAAVSLMPLPSPAVGTVAAALGMAGYLAACLIAHNSFFLAAPVAILGFPSLALLFAGVLILSLHPGSLLSRFFRLPVLRFYGRLSYGIYLWHYLFSDRIEQFELWLSGRIPQTTVSSFLGFFTVLLASTAVAMLSYRFIELPFLRLKHRFEITPR